MPDGTTPLPPDPARAALDAARRSLEADLAGHPDWIALGALLSGAVVGTVADRTALEARLDTVPAYRALRDLDRAAGLLRSTPATPTTRSTTPDMRPKPVDIVDATLVEDEAPPPTGDTPRRDDLTRLRGVDAELARRLAAIGITSFTQIAGWSSDDVRTIAQGLGLGRNFVRQNVVDQATILLAQQRQVDAAAIRARTRIADPAGVASWSGRPPPPPSRVRPRATMPPPLATAVRQSVLGRIRRGPKAGTMMPLTDMAPELAAPVFIAIDADQPDAAPSWLPVPIVTVLPPRRVEALPAVRHPRSASGLVPPAAIASMTLQDPVPSLPPKAVRPAPVPLHEIAGRRLDAIEAALAALPQRASMPASATPPSPAALAHRMAARRDAARPHDEADVTIVTHVGNRTSLTVIGPTPPPSTARAPVFQTPCARGFEEAAVSIVRPARAIAPALATPPRSPATASRRFDILRALFRLPREAERVRPV